MKRDFSHELHFTEVYRAHLQDHPALREAYCLQAQFPAILTPIQDGDLIAARVAWGLVGFSPHNNPPESGFGYYCDDIKIIDAVEKDEIPLEQREGVWDMLHFWQQETTQRRVEAAFSDRMRGPLFHDEIHPLPFNYKPMIGQPIYRMAGIFLDYPKLLSLGIPGLEQDLRDRLTQAEDGEGDPDFYRGLLLALEALRQSCLHYSRQARDQAAIADKERQKQLEGLAAVLEANATRAPQSFWEALQLSFLYSMMSGTLEFGRMDVYLGDFYVRDLESGLITEADAVILLSSVWRLINEQIREVDGRVIIGGRGRPNEANADRFAYLALKATRAYGRAILPQLTLRFYEGMDPGLMAEALDLLSEGHTFPLLYNDDVLVPAVSHALDVPMEIAEHYVPLGCGEIVLDHMGFGTPSGAMNVLKALEVTLYNGMDPISGKQLGLPTGHLRDFETFEDLFHAYEQQLLHVVEILAEHEELEYIITGEQSPYLLLSLLYDDCVARGKGMFSGGIQYLGGTLETYGNVNAADSLTAIKELVFDRKVLNPDRLLAALRANFRGYETERRLMQACPKYGNDSPAADSMMVRLHNFLCNTIRDQRQRTNLDWYLAVIINNAQNTTLARWVGASADGRRAGMPMANANTPAGGNDQKGITALINSIIQPDPAIHAGAVQNMRFSQQAFRENRLKVETLLDTYFSQGGCQAMLTVINRGDLEQALVEPEKYQDVFVRVGGFSARFVDLPRDVQVEILSRTTY